MNTQDIAKHIDHSILSPALTHETLVRGVEEAIELGVYAVCVKPCDVIDVRKMLDDVKASTKLCSVVSFPHGNSTLSMKLIEVAYAVDCGCDEVDYVINVSNVMNGDWYAVANEFDYVTRYVKDRNPIVVKAILETAYTRSNLKMLCELAVKTGIDFVKTSTGFAETGAHVEDVVTMANACKGSKCQVKASGGIKTWDKMKSMLNAGATRIGTSSTRTILAQAKAEFEP